MILGRLFALGFFIILSGCNLLQNEEEDDSNGNDSGIVLDGTFISECEDDGSESSNDVYVFDGNNVESTYFNYNSNGCPSGDKFDRFRYERTYTYDGAKFTLKNVRGYYTPYDSSDVSSMNSNNDCGFNDWAVGVEKDLNNTDPNTCFAEFEVGKTYTIDNLQQSGDDLVLPSGVLLIKQ